MREVLEVEFEGETYKVTYSVAARMVTVSTAYSSKTTQLGGSTPEQLARIMAKEVLRQDKQKGMI
jgi:hypothetical protein